MVMFKSLFIVILGFSALSAHSAVQVRWLSVASVLIEDGESKILFDPDWTRPNLLQMLNLSRLTSDEELVLKELKRLKVNAIDGIFTSHSHFDHGIDAPIVARITNAVNYVDESSLRISNAYKDPRIKTLMIPADGVIQIGKFKITAIKRDHAEIGAIMMKFLPGEVPKDFDFRFWDYHEGQTWFYVIEHPEMSILIDQGAHCHSELIPKEMKSFDVLIQGVANRKSDQDIIKGYLTQYRPKIFIPVHFDNFFKDFNFEDESELFGVHLDELLGLIRKELPQVKVIKPKYGEVINL